jgi:hypothetical protein
MPLHGTCDDENAERFLLLEHRFRVCVASLPYWLGPGT